MEQEVLDTLTGLLDDLSDLCDGYTLPMNIVDRIDDAYKLLEEYEEYERANKER